MITYQIKGWSTLFETAKTRGVVNKSYGTLPLKTGLGFSWLMDHPEGASIYGAFIMLTILCHGQRGETREGWLTDNGKPDGRPIDAADLARQFNHKSKPFELAFQVLSDPAHKVEWLIAHKVGEDSPSPEEDASVPAGPKPAELGELYNALAAEVGLPKMTKLTKTRADKARTRIGEGIIDQWSAICVQVKKSGHLKGDNGWRMDFDFLVNTETNWIAIIEGKYAGEKKAPEVRWDTKLWGNRDDTTEVWSKTLAKAPNKAAASKIIESAAKYGAKFQDDIKRRAREIKDAKK